MSSTSPVVTAFSGTERAKITWISLPDDLDKWVRENRDFVDRVQYALSDTYESLSEDQIWSTIAEINSIEWCESRAGLLEAQAQWDEHHSSDKRPLGLIGDALDSNETNEITEKLTISMADFTIINEGLRQRTDLSKLLQVLLVQKRMLEHSAEETKRLEASTAELASLDLQGNPQKSLRESFHVVSSHTEEHITLETRTSLSDTFSSFAKRILGLTTKTVQSKNTPTL